MKLALLGDIGLLGEYSLINNSKLLNNLADVAKYLSQFDIVVGNLETPFSYRKKPNGAKSSYICTDPVNVDVLKALNVDAVSIANNHIFDFGKEGFETTLSALDNAGIAWFGANGKDYRIELNNNKLAFNGFCCYSTNPLKISPKYGANGLNRFNIEEICSILQKNDSDGWLNILSVHSGIEHINYPSIDQIKISRLFADIAPYVWYGHHPHVIQGIEFYKDSLIAHSLGNFCFAGNVADKNRPIIELSDNNRRGMILELEIENNRILSSKPTIIFIGDDGSIELTNSSGVIDRFSSMIPQAINNIVQYNAIRRQQRTEYLSKRKELRNFSWFMKHLRLRYLRLLWDNKRNARRYESNVRKYIK